MTTMALATLCPSTTPSYDGTGKKLTPGAKRIRYGGDYETRVARSFNPSNQTTTINYDSLLIAECDALEDWLELTKGVTSFNITGVDWIDSALKFVYVDMSRSPKKPGYDTVSINLDRVFA